MSPRRLLALVLVATSCRGLAPAPPIPGTFAFEGGESFQPARLEEIVRAEIAGSGVSALDRAAIDDAAYALQLFYVASGFPFARVDYRVTGEDVVTGARFLIEEGVRTALEVIETTGNEAFDDETLLALASQRDPDLFVQAEVEALATAIRDFYRDRGHARASVGEPRVELEGATASVELVVDEGPLFRLTELAFDGASEDVAGVLAAIREERLEVVYTPYEGQTIRARLLEAHRRVGHADCAVGVEVEADEETGAVRLAFRIEPGPVVTISAIRVEGNEETDEDLILSRVELEPGERYDTREVQRSFRRLYATGLFESVELELDGTEGAERLLVVRVVELSSLEVYLEPGWGSYEGPRLRSGVVEKNLFGSGRRLTLETSVSPKDLSGELGLFDPWFLGRDLEAQASLSGSRREEPSFESSELGAGLSVRREWTERFSTTLGYRYTITRLKDVDVSVSEPELFDDVDVGSLTGTVQYVDRDSFLVPRRGGSARLQLEWASEGLGGEIDYLGAALVASRAFSLHESTVLALAARTEVIVPTGATTVIPLQLRLFNGGENTVRSFEQSELGPKDAAGEPVGGEAMTVLNAELRQDLAGALGAVLFYDFGNLALENEDYFHFDGFRSGVGLGLRYLLPIGPVRLDLGYNPAARDDEDDLVLHLAVGWPF
jgi:outer membrane protein assembly complex protein YaeT